MRPGLASVGGFWRQRSRREQVYLAVMLAALAVFFYWFALVAPLRSLAADAERRHVAAQAEQVRFPGILEELSLRSRTPGAPVTARTLVQDASAAGLALTADDAAVAGRLSLRFEGAAPQALFAWLAQVRAGHGLAPVRATVTRGPAGLDGELVFTVAQP